MLRLDDVQRSFARALNGTRDVDFFALISDEGIDPVARFSIYHTNVMGRLTAALVSTYPVVRDLVDRGFFDYAADTFIRRTLPASSCLDAERSFLLSSRHSLRPPRFRIYQMSRDWNGISAVRYDARRIPFLRSKLSRRHSRDVFTME
jgi:hypothetical protein